MFLILCALDDLEALAFYQRCRAAGLPARVLTGEALSFAGERTHRLGDGEPVRSLIAVPGLSPITESTPTGVLNRLVAPPDTAWRYADRGERDYATAELYAFTVSVLASLPCPVRNRPSPGCMAGPLPHPMQVLAAARVAGLRCPDLTWSTESAAPQADWSAALATAAAGAAAATGPTSAETGPWSGAAGPTSAAVQVPVLDGQVLANGIPAPVAAGCGRLVRALGAGDSLVGVDFRVGATGWWLAGFTPLPAIGSLPPAAFDRLVGVLAPQAAAVA